ncbi:glycine--tRNA ligase subunit alpha [Candidatus Bandiella euplotis]|uniref:Glycine--tRNA ligase alpha subunit n=1 Tax=Candidatus Bandiella euplotis TaxID=1664265 RepID=A0ABZ0UMR0_9RICK|nr:glycine--tRNA ligase subunit alpha [Candidatus Bandiella woodruffii]WPX95968.1 Glycine--tRNA ligase alpha subunit [Candidatus Bandiella woodruffii]
MFFQDIIFNLQTYWNDQGCVILQPLDTEIGAGTSNPATMLKSLDDKKWNVAYVQPCRRPADGRYGQNPNRMQHYYQFQVLMKPSPDDIQSKCIESLKLLGIDKNLHDLRFVHSDWENPTLGAWGLGWEVWCNGMEIVQFTYMQQVGGIPCKIIPGEITYGIERLAVYIQNKDSVWDLIWNSSGISYGEIFLNQEQEFCQYNFHSANTEILMKHFEDYEGIANQLIDEGLVYPAYDYCVKSSHLFNVLEARGVLSVTERAAYIARVRNLAKNCCLKFSESSKY